MPEELQKVDDVPAALLEHKLFPVINTRQAVVQRGGRETSRKRAKKEVI